MTATAFISSGRKSWIFVGGCRRDDETSLGHCEIL